MNDCKDCPDEKRKELLNEYHQKRKTDRAAKRATDGQSSNKPSTVLFSADSTGHLCETLCADIGADANLMSADLLHRISEAGGWVQVEILTLARRFFLAADAPDRSQAGVVCQNAAKMDVDIHVRH